MFCSNCGAQVGENTKFCQSCGKEIGTSKDANHTSEQKTNEVKNYSPIFWKFFWIGVLLNLFTRGAENADSTALWLILLALMAVYIYKFSEIINEAMSSIGKKHWGALGLLALIPFGFWAAFLIVRSKLKPHGKWVSEHKSFRLSK